MWGIIFGTFLMLLCTIEGMLEEQRFSALMKAMNLNSFSEFSRLSTQGASYWRVLYALNSGYIQELQEKKEHIKNRCVMGGKKIYEKFFKESILDMHMQEYQNIAALVRERLIKTF